MHDCKSLCPVVTTGNTLVNRHTDAIQTVYKISSPASAKLEMWRLEGHSHLRNKHSLANPQIQNKIQYKILQNRVLMQCKALALAWMHDAVKPDSSCWEMTTMTISLLFSWPQQFLLVQQITLSLVQCVTAFISLCILATRHVMSSLILHRLLSLHSTSICNNNILPMRLPKCFGTGSLVQSVSSSKQAKKLNAIKATKMIIQIHTMLSLSSMVTDKFSQFWLSSSDRLLTTVTKQLPGLGFCTVLEISCR